MNNYMFLNENAIYYECGFSCDNVVFLNLGSEKYFITDPRYTIEAEEYAKDCEVIESYNFADEVQKILKKLKIKKIIYDPNDFKVGLYQKITANLKIDFEARENFSKMKRMVKTDDEIELLKKAAKIGRNGFKQLAKYIRKNGLKKTDQHLHFKAIEKLSHRGNYDLSFSPILGINENAAKPHALPTNKKLKLNDLILVDAGIKYKRYCSDRTRTSSVNFEDFSFKKEQFFKNKKYQKIYDIVYKSQMATIEQARTGMKASEVDKISRDIIDKAGYSKYFPLDTIGHGVGLDLHEFPSVGYKCDVIIEDNMVFTIEPGIYIPDEFGIRIEDTVVMKNGKAEII